MKHAAFQPPLGQLGKEALDGIEPGGQGGREVKGSARVPGQPLQHLGLLVGGVVVENDMHELARGHLRLDGVEKANELLMPMVLHAQGREQGRGLIARVVMELRTGGGAGHGAAAVFPERQAALGAVERPNIAFFVYRAHHYVGRRVDVGTRDVAQLGHELRVAGRLELPKAAELQAMAALDALHRNDADLACCIHRHDGLVPGIMDG